MLLPIANIFGVESWLIVLIVVLLLFGGKKIPELMRGVGQGVGELKKGMEDGQRQVQEALRHDPAPTPVVPATPIAHVEPATTNSPTSTPSNPV